MSKQIKLTLAIAIIVLIALGVYALTKSKAGADVILSTGKTTNIVVAYPRNGSTNVPLNSNIEIYISGSNQTISGAYIIDSTGKNVNFSFIRGDENGAQRFYWLVPQQPFTANSAYSFQIAVDSVTTSVKFTTGSTIYNDFQLISPLPNATNVGLNPMISFISKQQTLNGIYLRDSKDNIVEIKFIRGDENGAPGYFWFFPTSPLKQGEQYTIQIQVPNRPLIQTLFTTKS